MPTAVAAVAAVETSASVVAARKVHDTERRTGGFYIGVNNKEEIIAVIRSNWACFQKRKKKKEEKKLFCFPLLCLKAATFNVCDKKTKESKNRPVVQHFYFIFFNRGVRVGVEREAIGKIAKEKVIIYFETKSNRKNIVIADVK